MCPSPRSVSIQWQTSSVRSVTVIIKNSGLRREGWIQAVRGQKHRASLAGLESASSPLLHSLNFHVVHCSIQCLADWGNMRKRRRGGYCRNPLRKCQISTGTPPMKLESSVQFSHSVVSDSLWSHGLQHARPPCPSPTPGVHSNSCPLSQWCHLTISSSVVPFSSCLQSFPASGSVPMSQYFVSGSQSIGVSALASVLPMNTQDWSPLEKTDWISL